MVKKISRVSASLKRKLREFKDAGEALKEQRKENERLRDLLTETLAEVDPEGVGVVVDEADPKGTAFRQQNGPTKTWDYEGIVEYLHETGRWTKCSTRTLDIKKWEAEIAAGNIPKSTAQSFVKTGDRPAAFIRWGKAEGHSLR